MKKQIETENSAKPVKPEKKELPKPGGIAREAKEEIKKEAKKRRKERRGRGRRVENRRPERKKRETAAETSEEEKVDLEGALWGAAEELTGKSRDELEKALPPAPETEPAPAQEAEEPEKKAEPAEVEEPETEKPEETETPPPAEAPILPIPPMPEGNLLKEKGLEVEKIKAEKNAERRQKILARLSEADRGEVLRDLKENQKAYGFTEEEFCALLEAMPEGQQTYSLEDIKNIKSVFVSGKGEHEKKDSLAAALGKRGLATVGAMVPAAFFGGVPALFVGLGVGGYNIYRMMRSERLQLKDDFFTREEFDDMVDERVKQFDNKSRLEAVADVLSQPGGRGGRLPESAPEEKPNEVLSEIKIARNWDEFYQALKKIGPVKGNSGKEYPPEKFIQKIEQARETVRDIAKRSGKGKAKEFIEIILQGSHRAKLTENKEIGDKTEELLTKEAEENGI